MRVLSKCEMIGIRNEKRTDQIVSRFYSFFFSLFIVLLLRFYFTFYCSDFFLCSECVPPKAEKRHNPTPCCYRYRFWIDPHETSRDDNTRLIQLKGAKYGNQCVPTFPPFPNIFYACSFFNSFF